MHFSQFVTRYFKKIGVFLSFCPPPKLILPPPKMACWGGRNEFWGGKNSKEKLRFAQNLDTLRVLIFCPPPKKNPVAAPDGHIKMFTLQPGI